MKKYRLSVLNSILAGVLICGMLAACGEAGKNFAAPDAAERDPGAPTFVELSNTVSDDEPEAPADSPSDKDSENADDSASSSEELSVENETAKKIIEIAKENLGVKYASNGSKPETGFDSSGFVYYCFKQSGIDVPRRVKDLITDGEEVDYDGLKPGDIAFFSAEEGGKANFCGIYVGGGLIIYSPAPGGEVKTAVITTNYWTTHFVSGARYL